MRNNNNKKRGYRGLRKKASLKIVFCDLGTAEQAVDAGLGGTSTFCRRFFIEDGKRVHCNITVYPKRTERIRFFGV